MNPMFAFGSPDAAAGAAIAGGVLAGVMFFVLILLAIILLLTAFWIWMIVDCATRRTFKNDSDKTMWLLFLCLSFIIGFHWLVAIIYYFAIRRPHNKRHRKRR